MDAATLKKIMGNRSGVDYAAEVAGCNEALKLVGATTVLRAAHFLAQCGHESGGLVWREEIASGAAYEWRKNLGNTQAGDGVRFKGRSFVQVTGRYNYRLMSEWAHSKGLVPTATYFVDNPTQLAATEYRWLGPVWYFTTQRPNWKAAADDDDIVTVTEMVNGGTNGLADRRAYLARAKAQGRKILPTETTKKEKIVGLDYYNVQPHATILTRSYTPGRAGHKIEAIYRHHMAGNLNLQQCVNLWNNSGTSAHYTVNSTGGIGQAVYDSNTAWATGNTRGNQRGISIEHANITRQVGGSDTHPGSWNISNATITNGARLAAALCLYYKLGRPVYGKNIKDHRDVRQTFCPGHLAKGGKYHDQWMREAQSFYDKLVAKSVNPDGTPKKGTSTKPTATETSKKDDPMILKTIRLVLDQFAGPDRNKAGLPKFTGWPQLGNKTLVDAVAEIRTDIKTLIKLLQEKK